MASSGSVAAAAARRPPDVCPRRGTPGVSAVLPRRLPPSRGRHRCRDGGTHLGVYLDLELFGRYLVASRGPPASRGQPRRRACGPPPYAFGVYGIDCAARRIPFVL